LSVNWTFNVARFLRIRLAAGGSALALTAIAGGVVGIGLTSAGPASAAAAAPASRAASAGFQSGAGRSVTLTALSSSPSAARPSVSGGGKGGGGKASKPSTPRQIAWHMLKRFHWSARHQFRYLNKLWARESGWNVHALNPYSGAAGIPQAVPGSKMASAGPNWSSNARTQIRWGLRYIRARYGSPRRAWDHEASVGWY
jgi:hypothetical protein